MPHDTEALYREHGAAVAKLCRSLLRDRAEAEDATQQVFLYAHRALLDGTTPREPLAWLLAVARNECYARFRRRSMTPVPVGEAAEGTAADASVHVLRAGELARVWDEVGRMPPVQREAFLLREIRGLSYGQLADELSLSPPSVRSLLLRARTRLRRRLRDVALGGAPWLQGLVRLVGGGNGASPVPAATKAAAAAGLGALALVGGGDVPRPAPHRSAVPARVAVKHRAGRVRHVSAPPDIVAVVPRAHGSGIAEPASRPERAESRDDGRSGSDSSSGRDGGSDGDTAAATPVTQTTSDGPDGGGGGSSSGPRLGGTTSSDGGRPGPSSGSDGGGGSDGGSGSSGSDDGGSGSSDGG